MATPPPRYRAQTSKQVKAAYKRRAGPTVTASQVRRGERWQELENRKKAAEEKERRRKQCRDKRLKMEAKVREARLVAGLPPTTQGYISPRQTRIHNFFGQPDVAVDMEMTGHNGEPFGKSGNCTENRCKVESDDVTGEIHYLDPEKQELYVQDSDDDPKDGLLEMRNGYNHLKSNILLDAADPADNSGTESRPEIHSSCTTQPFTWSLTTNGSQDPSKINHGSATPPVSYTEKEIRHTKASSFGGLMDPLGMKAHKINQPHLVDNAEQSAEGHVQNTDQEFLDCMGLLRSQDFDDSEYEFGKTPTNAKTSEQEASHIKVEGNTDLEMLYHSVSLSKANSPRGSLALHAASTSQEVNLLSTRSDHGQILAPSSYTQSELSGLQDADQEVSFEGGLSTQEWYESLGLWDARTSENKVFETLSMSPSLLAHAEKAFARPLTSDDDDYHLPSSQGLLNQIVIWEQAALKLKSTARLAATE
ncbi:hypothetical protein MMC19_005617 [Ptychographa xylographoides]|nr:hypothetical protein [Ptychographa xylographoides]